MNNANNDATAVPYKVCVYTTPANIPAGFLARHAFIVVSRFGVLSRYEVLFQKKRKTGGYVYKDFLPPLSGLPVFFFSKKYCFKSKCIGCIEGDANSVARHAADLIEDTLSSYPYKNSYNLLGTNSNTYVDWILKQCSQIPVVLPWNCFGKKIKT
jgi:hypothetical protein